MRQKRNGREKVNKVVERRGREFGGEGGSKGESQEGMERGMEGNVTHSLCGRGVPHEKFKPWSRLSRWIARAGSSDARRSSRVSTRVRYLCTES